MSSSSSSGTNQSRPTRSSPATNSTTPKRLCLRSNYPTVRVPVGSGTGRTPFSSPGGPIIPPVLGSSPLIRSSGQILNAMISNGSTSIRPPVAPSASVPISSIANRGSIPVNSGGGPASSISYDPTYALGRGPQRSNMSSSQLLNMMMQSNQSTPIQPPVASNASVPSTPVNGGGAASNSSGGQDTPPPRGSSSSIMSSSQRFNTPSAPPSRPDVDRRPSVEFIPKTEHLNYTMPIMSTPSTSHIDAQDVSSNFAAGSSVLASKYSASNQTTEKFRIFITFNTAAHYFLLDFPQNCPPQFKSFLEQLEQIMSEENITARIGKVYTFGPRNILVKIFNDASLSLFDNQEFYWCEFKENGTNTFDVYFRREG